MGVKSKKKAKTRLDAYYRLAKDQGYRARSAFKLIQLNRKYDFLAKARVLVDLCAAPGGWCQVAAKYMPVGSKIVGVDLVPIAPIRGVKTFVGDITDDKTRKMIVTWLKKEPVDCVIHDGAPNVGGVWSRDLFEQNALVLAAAKMASSMLTLNGWFVTKVFRSQDFHKLLWVLKQLFEKVEATKPLASRMESAEIFVVCAGYKAPKHIDSAMFNAQHVFSDVGEEKLLTPSGLLVAPKSNVPMGYNEFATVSHHVASFSEFVRCADPKAFLKTHHELRFAGAEDKQYLRSKSSKKELVFLCGDLQQVGPADVRRLLRWREQLLREASLRVLETERQHDTGGDDMTMTSDADSAAAALSDRDEEEDEEGDDDGEGDAGQSEMINFDDPEDVTRIARELLELRKKKAKEMKKKQKKVVDRKLKQIKGLINHDPNASADHLTDVDDFGRRETEDGMDNDATIGRGGARRCAAAHSSDELAEEDHFTVDKLALVDESEIASMMDANYEAATAHEGNDPLNPVISADLVAQEDWDLGNTQQGDGNNDITAPAAVVESAPLVEGNEYFMDVDNYGNYIHAKRSARVVLFEEGLERDNDDEDEDGGANDTYNAEAGADSEDDEDDARGRAASKRKNHAAQEKSVADSSATAAAGGGTEKQSKWQRHHRNIDKVLNETFPTPKANDSVSRAHGKKRQAVLEEERIHMSATVPLSLSESHGARRKRTRFENNRLSDEDDEKDTDDDESEDANWARANAEEEADTERALAALEVNEGRIDSRRKRRVVPDMGKLTTQELVRQQRKQVLQDNKELRKRNRQAKNATGGGGAGSKKKGSKEDTQFEEIPMALTDPEIRARTLAIAQKMLDPRARRDILEASVNRYVFNDDEDLPDWFVKDEHRNCKVMLPVTAEEIEAQRQRFRELNARPSKKVMEAMGRKRRRAQRALRSLIEKGKADPRAREKAGNLSVRKLMRSQMIKGTGKKKSKYMDSMLMGERRREKARMKRKGGKKR